MKKSMKERFREVERVPMGRGRSGCDRNHQAAPSEESGYRVVALFVAATALGVVLLDEKDHRSGPAPDVSWLLSETQMSCVEQYSPGRCRRGPGRSKV